MKIGGLIFDGVLLEAHEIVTIEFLVSIGKGVELLKPSRQKGVKTPDVIFDGRKWEMKSPKGNGKYTIQHAFKAAAKQSEYVVIDIRRIDKVPDENIINKIHREVRASKVVKHVLVITKTGRVVDIKK